MRILIIGAGHSGSLLAKRLAEKGHEVIIVDKNPERAQMVAHEADVQAYARDATDPSLYDEIDMLTIDVVVAVTDKDEVNLFVAALAKEYNVPRIIAKARDARIALLMERFGIEYVVPEPQITARIIESIIEGKYSVVELVPAYSGNYALISITLTESSNAVGKTLEEVEYDRSKAKILAVFDGQTLLDPSEVTQLQPNYEVIALVRRDYIEEFMQAFR